MSFLIQANILVDDSGRGLLSDFGIAKGGELDDNLLTSVMKTNIRWLAYELCERLEDPDQTPPQCTTETDIFAFGCTCFEVSHFATGILVIKDCRLNPCSRFST